MAGSYYYCKAGFKHLIGEGCDHVYELPRSPMSTTGYRIPDDFYSPEATAKRKAENKLKYAPASQRSAKRGGHLEEINRAYTIDRAGGKPYIGSEVG